MSLALAIALYFVIWWTTLFAVLPWGLRTQAEDGRIVPGTPESAPARPRLALLFLINTLVAGVLFGLVWLLYTSGWLGLSDLANLPSPGRNGP